MTRLCLVLVASCIGIIGLGRHSTASGQERTDAARLAIEITLPIEPGSKLRVMAASGDICAEIPLEAARTSYAAEVTSGDGCRVAKGDALAFWLVHPNGGIELLSQVDGTPASWDAGATIEVRLGAVPCPEPCNPPAPGGSRDPEPAGLPETGTRVDGSQPWSRLLPLALAVPAMLVWLEWRRRRHG
jgi:hypothetical protein